MSTELKTLESDVIAIPDDIDLDKLGRLIDAVRFAKEFVGTIDALLKCKMMDLIAERGDLTIGDIRYYVSEGGRKKEKVKDNVLALDTLMTLAEGDMDGIGQALSSGWLKPGHFRTLCQAAGKPELFDSIFETTVEDELREGKPKKRLESVDTKFLTKGKVTA